MFSQKIRKNLKQSQNHFFCNLIFSNTHENIRIRFKDFVVHRNYFTFNSFFKIKYPLIEKDMPVPYCRTDDQVTDDVDKRLTVRYSAEEDAHYASMLRIKLSSRGKAPGDILCAIVSRGIF